MPAFGLSILEQGTCAVLYFTIFQMERRNDTFFVVTLPLACWTGTWNSKQLCCSSFPVFSINFSRRCALNLPWRWIKPNLDVNCGNKCTFSKTKFFFPSDVWLLCVGVVRCFALSLRRRWHSRISYEAIICIFNHQGFCNFKIFALSRWQIDTG